MSIGGKHCIREQIIAAPTSHLPAMADVCDTLRISHDCRVALSLSTWGNAYIHVRLYVFAADTQLGIDAIYYFLPTIHSQKHPIRHTLAMLVLFLVASRHEVLVHTWSLYDGPNRIYAHIPMYASTSDMIHALY